MKKTIAQKEKFKQLEEAVRILNKRLSFLEDRHPLDSIQSDGIFTAKLNNDGTFTPIEKPKNIYL